MKKLILDYSTWRCGDDGEHRLGEGDTLLLNNEGFMCCLGQFSKQLLPSIIDRDLLLKGEPQATRMEIPVLTKWDNDGEDYLTFTAITTNAITINDDEKTTPEDKIVKLKELFLKEGFEIQVINKP